MKDNFKKNVVWNTIGVFAFSLTSLFYTIILMRFSNLKMTGIFSFGFALACTTTALAALGGRTYQVTDVKNELSPFTYIFSKYLTVLSVTIFSLFYILMRDYSIIKFLVVFLLCIFKYMEEISDVYYGIIQKEDKLYYVGQLQLVKSVLNVLSFFLIIRFKGSLLLAVISMVIINLLFIVLFERPTAKKIKKWNYNTSKKQIIKLLKVNATICLFTFLTMYLANSSKYAIDIYLTDEIQAIFGILIMPATMMLLICNFIINPLLIKIASLYNDKKIIEITKMFKTIILLITGIGLLALVVCYIIGIPFLNLIYASNFNKYKFDFMIIILGAVFYSISTICSSFLTSIRKINIQLYINVIFAAIALLLSVLLVRKFGIMGGALAYAIIMFIRMIVYFFISIKSCRIEE